MELLRRGNPNIDLQIQQERDRIHEWIRDNQHIVQQRAVVTIPVHVIIIHEPSEAVGSGKNLSLTQIQSQIDVLNEDFRRLNTDASNTPSAFSSVVADCEIEFCLASLDPQGNATDGVTRYSYNGSTVSQSVIENTIKPATSWLNTNYLNMWVGNVTGGVLGYAYFPNTVPANRDGVVVLTEAFGRPSTSGTYNLGRTATHEVGHWLALDHVWGGGCGSDDGIADTPDSDSPYYGCPNFPQSSCGSSDMFMNYMDYVNDNCMNAFTLGQKAVMTAVLNGSRSSILTAASQVCNVTPPPTPPVAEFTASPTSGCEGVSVTFTDQSTNNPTSWSWSFPGGTPSTSTAQNPTVTYSTAGTYNVTLTATNADGSDGETKNGYITVNDCSTPPTADFTASTTSGCEGTSITFTDQSSGNPTSWSWSFSGGSPSSSTSQNPTVTYNSAGTYNVTLTATNSDGSDIETKNGYITITNCSAPPTADFTASSGNICPTQSVTFTDQSTGSPTSWSWSFPGGTPATSSAQNPTVTYNTAGVYDVTLTASNSNGSDVQTYSGLISVGSGQGLPLSEGFEGTTFPPLGWQNFNQTNDPFTWERTTTAASGSSASALFNNYDGNNNSNPAGTLDWLILPDLDLSGSSGTQMTFDVAYAPYDATFDDTLLIAFAINCDTLYSLLWEKGGADLGTAPATTSQFVPTSSQWRTETIDLSQFDGVANVSLAIINYSGWGNQLFIDNVNISAPTGTPPTAGFMGSPTTVCAGNDVTFSDQSTGSPTSWSWSFPGGTPATSSFENPTISYNTPGTYDVSLTVTNANGSDSETLTGYITVQNCVNPPVAEFTASNTNICEGDDVTFNDLSTNTPTSWSWSFPGGTPSTSTAQNPTVAYNTAGTYTVVLTATNAGGNDTETKTGYVVVNDCSSGPQTCDTINNLNNGNILLYTSSGGGYVAGQNEYSDAAKADYFTYAISGGETLSGAYFGFGAAVDGTGSSTVTFKVWEGTSSGPTNVLATTTVPISDIIADISGGVSTYVDFGGIALPSSGEFFVGLDLDYSNGDTVALYTNTSGETSPATAWEQWSDNNWYTYDDNQSWGLAVAHFIFPVICTNTVTPIACPTDQYEDNDVAADAAALPLTGILLNAQICPAGDEDWYGVTITQNKPNLKVLLRHLAADLDLELYDSGGNQIAVSNNTGTQNERIVANGLTPGQYTVRVMGSNGAETEVGYYLRKSTRANPYPNATVRFSPVKVPNGVQLAHINSNDGGDVSRGGGLVTPTVPAFESFNLYPNPTKNLVTAAFSVETEEVVELAVTDVYGKKVLIQTLNLTEGVHNVQLDLTTLASGVYFVSIQNETSKQVRKLQVVK